MTLRSHDFQAGPRRNGRVPTRSRAKRIRTRSVAWDSGRSVAIFQARPFIPTLLQNPGLRQPAVRPDAAFYDTQLGEFLLMYDDVRQSESPTTALLDFCQSTYSAAATHGGWDRHALERQAGAVTRQA